MSTKTDATTESPNVLKRYDPRWPSGGGGNMEEYTEGGWVKFEYVELLQTELTAALEDSKYWQTQHKFEHDWNSRVQQHAIGRKDCGASEIINYIDSLRAKVTELLDIVKIADSLTYKCTSGDFTTLRAIDAIHRAAESVTLGEGWASPEERRL